MNHFGGFSIWARRVMRFGLTAIDHQWLFRIEIQDSFAFRF
jgi:hypothetical protein